MFTEKNLHFKITVDFGQFSYSGSKGVRMRNEAAKGMKFRRREKEKEEIEE